MILGVMSDSHDHVGNIARAVEVFQDRGIGALIHGGDLCSPFVFRELGKLKAICPAMYAVYGNPDMPTSQLLCGVTPRTWLETGYLFGEYVPLTFTDRFMDPAQFQPRMAGYTRFGRQLINGAFYGKVNLTARS